MTTETNPFLLGVTLKDLDSNVRSEISYLDRNLTAGMNTNTGNIVQNTTAQGALLRDQMNRSTDFVVSDAHRNTDSLAGTVDAIRISYSARLGVTASTWATRSSETVWLT